MPCSISVLCSGRSFILPVISAERRLLFGCTLQHRFIRFAYVYVCTTMQSPARRIRMDRRRCASLYQSCRTGKRTIAAKTFSIATVEYSTKTGFNFRIPVWRFSDPELSGTSFYQSANSGLVKEWKKNRIRLFVLRLHLYCNNYIFLSTDCVWNSWEMNLGDSIVRNV